MALVEANAFHVLYVTIATADAAIKREVVWVVCNAVSNRDPQILQHLAKIGWIPGLITFLREKDYDLQLCALDALHHFLEWGHQNKVSQNVDGKITQVNMYAEIVETAGGNPVLEELLRHESEEIYNKAMTLLTSFLGFQACDDTEQYNSQFSQDDGTVTFQETEPQGNYEF